MTKLFTSPWMTVPVGAIIYVAATLAFWKVPPAPAPAGDPAPKASVNGPSWQFTNPEADQLIAELRTEKNSLSKREQQLNELEMRVRAEQAELNEATQSVHRLQQDYDQAVLRVQSEETANLKKLAKVYAAMAPESAALILAQMDDNTIAKIMVFMKDSETAAILEGLGKKGDAEAKRAAALSDRLRVAVYRNDPAK